MKVSIVTINLNNAIGIKNTIQSIRLQSFQDYEFIVTDGLSTDDSLDVIKANEDIVDSWVSEKDCGIYDAMNKSLQRCHGEYVIFMNSGDCFYDERVLENVFTSSTTEDVIYGDVILGTFRHANPSITSLQDFYCKSPFCHQAVFVKLSIAKRYGFDTDYRIVADWKMFYQIFVHNGSFRYVPVTIARCDDAGISNIDVRKNNAERMRFFKTMYPDYILRDYDELIEIKNGILWKYYQKLDRSKKLKYYVLTLLRILKINPNK